MENFITYVGIEFNKLYSSQMRTESELSVLRHAEKTDFLVLAAGNNLMEVKNTKGFKPN